jgi:outer membrane protein insertion porin family/translocation and assembly module TamA
MTVRSGPYASLLLAIVCAGCSVKTVPPRSTLVDRVDVITADKPRVAGDDVKKRLVTRATSHFLPFQILAGVPVLGMFDALTVEYATFDRFVLQRDLDRVRRYYRSRGFYEAQVSAGRVVTTEKGHVRVEIVVREGEPVLIGSVEAPKELLARAGAPPQELEAALDANGRVQRLISELESGPLEDPPPCPERDKPECKQRPRLDEERYDQLKRSMLRALTDFGFAYAKVEGHVDVDLLAHRARLRFSTTTGPLCTFGEVKIAGNRDVPERLLRERIGIKRGDRYSSEKLDSAHDELAALGVFGSVDVRAVLPKEGEPQTSEVPIEVTVDPIKLRALKTGVGAQVGSQIELHTIVGWEDKNLLGGLRSFGVDAKPGVVLFPTNVSNLFRQAPTRPVWQVELITSFKQPSFPEKRTDMRVELAGKIYAPQIAPAPDPVQPGYNILGYYELNGLFGFDRHFRFPRIDRSSVYLGGFLRMQLAFPFSYNQDTAPLGYERVIIPFLDMVGSWDFRKDRSGKPTKLAPYKGVYTAFDAQLAFGDAKDFKLQPEVRVYRPIVDRLVFAFRWATGLLFPFDYGESLKADNFARCNEPVPPNVQSPVAKECARDLQLLSFRAFYSGGPFSNRGYGYREVGPHGQLGFATQQGFRSDAAFLPTGGMGTWEMSGELRFLVLDNLALVTFLDASDVVRTIKDFRFDHLHLSPGFGLRLGTPVGPIRVDVGFRPPYLQHLGQKYLARTEGGPTRCLPNALGALQLSDDRDATPCVLEGSRLIETSAPFPWAWSVAIGEAF